MIELFSVGKAISKEELLKPKEEEKPKVFFTHFIFDLVVILPYVSVKSRELYFFCFTFIVSYMNTTSYAIITAIYQKEELLVPILFNYRLS